MTIKEALEITKKVFDASIKAGMFSTIEDAASLQEVYITISQMAEENAQKK